MLEKILHFSLTQRFVIILGTVFLIVAGSVSWQNLTLDALPDITPNQVTINTPTPGMGPAEIERQVTFPIETAMGGIPGVQTVRSLSYYGLSQVVVTFSDEIDIYFARQLVNERLGTVHDQLPAGISTPQLGPISTGLGEIYFYAVESEKRSPMDLRTLQDWVIKPQMRTVPGVAEVNSIGGREKQFNVEIDPRKMQARSISLRQVLDALQKNNTNVGGGYIERNGEQTTIRSIGMAASLEDIAHIVVGVEHGTPILVSDMAAVKLDSPLRTGVSTKDGKEAVVGTVLMLKGANGRTVSRAAEARMKAIREQLPPDVKVTTLYNRSELVDQTIHTVARSLVEGGVLVVIVLLLLLGNLRGAIIAAAAIPLSMLIAVIAMNRFGVSGNLMSLGAIDFGLIVDGAIIMVENCVRRLAEQREHLGRRMTDAERRYTVAQACGEVRKVTQFGELIIIATYLPILALEGIEGKMFRPMALAVVFALLGALLLSLTLIPTLCSLLLSRDTQEKQNVFMNFSSKFYRPTLTLAFRHRTLVIGGALCLVTFAGLLFPHLGTEFIPQLDEGSIDVHPIRLRTVGADESVNLLIAMEKSIKEIPEVVTVFSRAGTSEVANDPMPISFGDTFIMLKPRDQWRPGMTTKAKLLDEIQDRLRAVPGQGYGFTQPIQDRFDELASGVKADIGIKVFGEDLTVLKQKAEEIAARIRKVPGAQDVSVEQVDDIPVMEIKIDRQAIARVGVNVSDIQEWVETTLGGRAVGQIVDGDKRFDLTVRLPERLRADAEAIQALPIAAPNGGSVPLASLTALKTVSSPAQVSRDSSRRRVVVQCNVRGRDLGGFAAQAQSAIKRDVKLESGYYLEWGGQFENLQRAKARLAVVVPIALLLIFALLFTTFGSIKQALLIYTGIPLAITGGVIALWARSLPFSISAGVGFIALSGVAVLNGVVMVSAINRLREQGKTIAEAVRLGAMQRLRPVLMTALVAALGFIPMALNTDIGAEVQRPLATVVIGGILSSTLLTLVVLPTLYLWFARDKHPGGEA